MARHAVKSLRSQSEDQALQEARVRQQRQRRDEWPAAEKGNLLHEKPNPIAEGMPGYDHPPVPNGAMELDALWRLLFTMLPTRLLCAVRDCIQAGCGIKGHKFSSCLQEEIPDTLYKLQCDIIKVSHLRNEYVPHETLPQARAAHRILTLTDKYTTGLDKELHSACKSHIDLIAALTKVTESAAGPDRTGALNNAIARAVLSCKDPQAFEPYRNRMEMLNHTAARLFRYGTNKTLLCRLLDIPARSCLLDDMLFYSEDDIREAYSYKSARERQQSPYYHAFISIAVNFYEIILGMMSDSMPRYLRGLRTNTRVFLPLAAAGAYDALRMLIREASCFEPFTQAYGISHIPTLLEFLDELNNLIYGRSHFELCGGRITPNKKRGPRCLCRFLVSDMRSRRDYDNFTKPTHTCPICQLRRDFMVYAKETQHAKADSEMERARNEAYLRQLSRPPAPWNFSY